MLNQSPFLRSMLVITTFTCFWISNPSIAADPSPADNQTALIEEDSSIPLGQRIPLILIHGIHGNQANGSESDFIFIPNSSYFLNLIVHYKMKYDNSIDRNNEIMGKFKFYRFHYVSDIGYSVKDIAKALRNKLDALTDAHPAELGNRQIVILAHSMGGLVARSYMEEWSHLSNNAPSFLNKKGGDRVLRLITLATPHRGTPAANDSPRYAYLDSPLTLGLLDTFVWYKRDTVFHPGSSLGSVQQIYEFTTTEEPNRSDLLWDDYRTPVWNTSLGETNNWLNNLNSNAMYNSKIYAYYGSLNAANSQQYDDLSDDSLAYIVYYLWENRFDDITSQHNAAAAAAVLISRFYPFFDNDGLVPSDSASFAGGGISANHKRHFPGYDHLDMKDDRYSNGHYPLFERVTADLYSAVPASAQRPHIASISPSSFVAPSPTQPLLILGSGFTSTSTLTFNGLPNLNPITFINSTQIQYTPNLPTAGTYAVKVFNGSIESDNYWNITVVAAPPPATGTLVVTLLPTGAVSAGAQWRVDNGAYHNSGEAVPGLTPGSHTVSCKPVTGYTTPANKVVTITGGNVTNDTETYTAIGGTTYTLSINSNHGTVYRNPNRNTFSSGETVRLTATADSGWHFVNWSGNASGAANPLDLVMNSNKNVTANYAVGGWTVGTLNVTILPAAAVAAGARWRADGGAWQNSGASITNAYIGTHYVEFSNVIGWTTPTAQLAPVVGGQTTSIIGTYSQNNSPGTLTVTLTPPAAVTAGVKWRVNGGAPQSSGTSLSLPAGAGYAVSFDSTAGWGAPSTQTVSIVNNQTTFVVGDYSPLDGQPAIVSVTPPVGALGGGTVLTIDGLNFISPVSVNIGGVPATNVVVVDASQLTCVTPPSATYGTVPVVVQASGGTATIPNGFTYDVPRGSNIELVTSFGGRVDAVAVSGNNAYIGLGSLFATINVATPTSPSLIGRIALPGAVRDIALFTQGGRNYACVAASDAGLYIVDVTTPAQPTIKGFYKTAGSSNGVAVLGGLAYVADAYAGLEIFDLANPALPTMKSAFVEAASANDIAVKASANGLFAYVATGGGMKIVDVGNPQAPVLRSFLDVGQWTFSIAVSGDRAFISFGQTPLHVDISNPDNPVNLGGFSSGFPRAMTVQGTNLYTAGVAGFHISNVSTGTPQITGFISNFYSDGFNMAVANNHAYVAGGEKGLIIVSVSNPSSPVERGRFTTGIGSYESVATAGQYAHAACRAGGYNIFDISNPAVPQTVKQLPIGGATKVIVNGNRAFLCDDGSNIRICDISIPASASQLGTLPQSAMFSWDISFYGGYLLASGSDASNFHSEVAVINVIPPSAPTVYAKKELSSSTDPATKVVNNDTKACVAIANVNEIRILNVSQSNNPVQSGQMANTGSVGSMAMTMDGQTLFVGNNAPEMTFRVFDIGDPSSPVLVSNTSIGGEVRGITLAPDGFVYLAAGGLGVLALDISVPSAPAIVRSYDTPGYAQQVAVDGEYLYVADSQAGLIVLRLIDMDAPEVFITNPTFQSTYSTNEGTLDLGGSASDNKGVTRVSWSNSRGGGSDAVGTDSWTVSGIVLQPGSNLITVTALDAAGNRSTDTLTVDYQSLKHDQSITFSPIADHVYGDSAITLNAAATSGLPITFTVVSGSVTVSGQNILNLTGAGIVNIQADQPGDANYNPASPVNVVFNVAKATQVVFFDPIGDKSANDPPFSVSASASSGLPVYIEVMYGPAVLEGTTVTLIGTGTVAMIARQPGNANYQAATPVQRTFEVRPLPQVISFGPLSSQRLGDAPFALIATASSGLFVSFSVDSGPATLDGNIVTVTGIGTVTIRASQGGDEVYAAAPDVTQSFTVTDVGLDQTISFDAIPNKTYGNLSFTINASASSGLSVSFAVSGPVTVTGNTVSITGIGSVSITASQAGDSTYNPAPNVTQSFTVGRATLTVTADDKSKLVGEVNPQLTAGFSGFVYNETAAVVSGSPSLSTTATTSSPIGTYPITVRQGTLSAANYSFSFVNGTLTVSTVQMYALTVISGSGGGSYEPGAVVTITANVPQNGKVFDQWTGAAVSNALSPTTTITMPASATTVTATYKDISAQTFSLTVVSGSGDGDYTVGTIVTIAADPPGAGMEFDRWTGAIVANATSSTTSLSMPAADTTVTATYRITASNNPPVITSAASVSKGQAFVGDLLTFNVAASDPDADTLTYSWAFGDGGNGTGSSVAHAYSSTGAFTATVTVSDGKGGIASSSVSVTVIERVPFTITAMAAQVKFGRSGQDSYSLSGVIPALPAGFSFAGKTITLDVGGAKTVFTMDAKGKAKNAVGALTLKLKLKKNSSGNLEFIGGDVAFTVKVKGTFQESWLDEGFDPAQTVKNVPMTFVVQMDFGTDKFYGASVTGVYSAVAHKTGKFKK